MTIVDISNKVFKKIFNDEQLYLPKRWDGECFPKTLEDLYTHYINQLEGIIDEKSVDEIRIIMRLLIETTEQYLNGFPADAFNTFKLVMKILSKTPLKVYEKSAKEVLEGSGLDYPDNLSLYRAVKVKKKNHYPRSRVFHTPYNLRSKVSTSRYSIAGYPCLYLSTSLDLVCNEIKADKNNDLILTAKYKLNRDFLRTGIDIQVIELGIKPQDFFDTEINNIKKRYIRKTILKREHVKLAYLLWYPLIAACSFIRVNKNDPFAAEYIIPQLLMQWVRTEFKLSENKYVNLIGIRYFSCASEEASDMGFNYVFPTSGKQISHQLPYCKVLAKAFWLTTPVYVNEYYDISDCEEDLNRSDDYKQISRYYL